MIGVIGAGAFGTALAIALSRDGAEVCLWARDSDHAALMEAARVNTRRLPNRPFPPTLRVTGKLDDLRRAEALLLAVPAQETAKIAVDLPRLPLVACAKGITRDGGHLQTDILPQGAAVLTGPGFAAEIAAGLPTALTLAAPKETGATLHALLARPMLRLYRTEDVIGAQLGGALKNVIAIACGIAVGARLGDSARAALMTRGFAEMRRLARAMGGRDETLAGLSGLGDLALTCAGPASRNFACGLAIGTGAEPAHATTEGVATAKAVTQLAARHDVEMPIAEATGDVLEGSKNVEAALTALLSRPQGMEDG